MTRLIPCQGLQCRMVLVVNFGGIFEIIFCFIFIFDRVVQDVEAIHGPCKLLITSEEDVYKPYDLFSNPDTLLTISCEMLCYNIA